MEGFKESFKSTIFSTNSSDFNEKALALFRYQAVNSEIYSRYVTFRGIDPYLVTELSQIPFLPIDFFKSFEVKSGEFDPEVVFTSSGTTGQVTSRHFVGDTALYIKNARIIFEQFYGRLNDYVIFALLPSYLEREGSSLVLMAEDFVKETKSELSGFYLNEHQLLVDNLNKAALSGKKILLLGVTFALLDLAENHSLNIPNLIVMETGGMKGRRKEMIREEVHKVLTKAFNVDFIHSEYGMTELLSQGYSAGNGLFNVPAWLKVLIRDPNDPYAVGNILQRGGINIIDLANIDSCAFIETMDLGKMYPDGSFEILGRFDNSDIRGCNLMVL